MSSYLLGFMYAAQVEASTTTAVGVVKPNIERVRGSSGIGRISHVSHQRLHREIAFRCKSTTNKNQFRFSPTMIATTNIRIHASS
ncbi:MAG: hypothetical protein NXY57DRAFT_44203 [Lentinula lateritia]|nr:MAG: hypothetical protein NXY57DRAFT_44203 [Lentinula lateritia]